MPRCTIWKAILGLVLAVVPSRADVAPLRFDFEKDEPGKLPADWHLTTAGYRALVTRVGASEGKQCVKIELKAQAPDQRVGIMLRSIDATPYRGRMIRLRGLLRVEPAKADDRVQFWLRVDRPSGQMGFFDNMNDRPVRNRAWTAAEIVGEVARDAEQIYFGVLAFGDAPAWVDDFRLEDDGPATAVVKEAARPLRGRGLDNLVAFTRLFGYVRHFHPSDAAAKADWDAVAIAGIREVEASKDSDDLAQRLTKIFEPLAPTIRVFKTGSDIVLPRELEATEKCTEVVVWNHLGFGNDITAAQGIYSSHRERWKMAGGRRLDGAPDPAQVFRADLGGGVSCLVPLALYADQEGTLPHLPKADPAPTREAQKHSFSGRYSGADRATRLADVALAWNILQHFYPYFDVVATDWPATLRATLTSAAQDADARAFLATLRRMVAALQDGHGGVYRSTGAEPAAGPPVAWDWIEARLVITRVGEGVEDINPGDTVRAIDGEPTEIALAAAEREISGATPQWRRYVALQRLGSGAPGSEVVLDLRAAGKPAGVRTVRLSRTPDRLEEARPPKIHEIRKAIYYVDVSRIDNDDLKRALPDLKRATGIIFDFRGYPSKLRPEPLFSHLIEKPVTSAQWHVPRIHRPDHQQMRFERSGEWKIPPSEPYLHARKAFITDGRAISYAESCLGIVEHYKLGAIVGGPTAGTNGNVNPVLLPGGYNLIWTGMKVLKHDGSRHHGVGILPTVPVSRTIAGVAAGRDEMLEKAVDAVSKERR